MTKRLRPLLILPLLALAYLAAGQLKGTSIEVVKPITGPAVEGIYATGTVEASVMLPIAPRVGARLMELNVDEGSRVTKGQVLAQLEDEDVQSSLKQLLAKEAFAEKEYQRTAAVASRGFATRAELERTQSEWNAAKADVANARAQLNFMKLLSPADGTIIRRDGEIGQLIAANQPVFWISCCAPLRISAEVDEEDITGVQPGQTVLIRADAFPGKIFNGSVQSITPKGDPVARTYRVRIGFEEEVPLMIGMTAENNIVLSKTEEALLIPASAIINGAVWMVKDGTLARQEVAIGARDAKTAQVKSGITKDDVIVRQPNDTLREGNAIRATLSTFSR